MQQILIDHTLKIAPPICCIFSPYNVQDISSFYLVQWILLCVSEQSGWAYSSLILVLYSSNIKSALGSGRERAMR